MINYKINRRISYNLKSILNKNDGAVVGKIDSPTFCFMHNMKMSCMESAVLNNYLYSIT